MVKIINLLNNIAMIVDLAWLNSYFFRRKNNKMAYVYEWDLFVYGSDAKLNWNSNPKPREKFQKGLMDEFQKKKPWKILQKELLKEFQKKGLLSLRRKF